MYILFLAIVYNALYEKVLDIQNVAEIVHTMLYEKQPVFVSTDNENINNQNKAVLDKNEDRCASVEELKVAKPSDGCTKDCCLQEQAAVVAPFPYKVAKALDPNIYRNIEYDTWTEIRRGIFIFYRV